MPENEPDQNYPYQERNPGKDSFEDTLRRNHFNSQNILNSDKDELKRKIADNLAEKEAKEAQRQRQKDLGMRSVDVDNDKDSVGNSLQKQEEDAGWRDDTKSRQVANRFSPKNFKAVRTASALFALVGVMLSVFGIFASLIGGALGLVNLKESAIQKLSERAESILERREARILGKRFSQDLTKGCTVQIKCRYRGFTNKEVKKFNNRASEYGWKMETTGRSKIPPFRHQIKLQKLSRDGTVHKSIAPKDIIKTMKYDSSLRKATNSFYKGKVEFYAGKAAKGVWTRTKSFLGKRNPSDGRGATDEERERYRQRQLVREATAGTSVDISSSTYTADLTDPDDNPNRQQYNEDVTDAIRERADALEDDRKDYTKSLAEPNPGSQESKKIYQKSVNNISGSGGGVVNAINPVGKPLDAMQGICIMQSIYKAVNASRHVDQAVQLIRYSVMIASLADRIKAGDADGDTAQQIGDVMSLLTAKDSGGMTAFDSLGYAWLTTGAVRKTKGEDVTKYQNGGPPPGVIGSTVGEVFDDKTVKNVCRINNSTEATIAIGVVSLVSLGWGSVARATVMKGITKTIEEGVEKKVQKELQDELVGKAMKNTLKAGRGVAGMEVLFRYGLPPMIAALSRSTTNTIVTGDQHGRDAGNAYVSGMGAATAQTGKAQGLEFISVAKAVKQTKNAEAYNLRIAKEDGINQLDPSNTYSFANKFSMNILPIASRVSSIVSLPTSLASLSSLGLNSIQNNTYARTFEEAQYMYCNDNDLTRVSVAGDPFCNPQLGFDEEIINGDAYDPEDVILYLNDRDWITDDGTPQGEFQTFIEKCMNTNSPLGEEDYCTKKNSQNYTMMRLYCMDTSIDNDMNDGEGVGCAPQFTDAAQAQAVEESGDVGEIPTGTAQELAKKIIATGKVFGDARYMGQIEAISNGDESCPVSVKILGLILAMSEKYKFTISSLNRKCTGVLTPSGEASFHYANGGGRAVDIGSINGVSMGNDQTAYPANAKPLAEKFFKDAVKILPKNSELGQINNCGLNVDTNGITDIVNDACNHVHIGIPD